MLPMLYVCRLLVSSHLTYRETGLEPEVFCRVLEPLLRVSVSVEEYVLLKAIMYCNASKSTLQIEFAMFDVVDVRDGAGTEHRYPASPAGVYGSATGSRIEVHTY